MSYYMYLKSFISTPKHVTCDENIEENISYKALKDSLTDGSIVISKASINGQILEIHLNSYLNRSKVLEVLRNINRKIVIFGAFQVYKSYLLGIPKNNGSEYNEAVKQQKIKPGIEFVQIYY